MFFEMNLKVFFIFVVLSLTLAVMFADTPLILKLFLHISMLSLKFFQL